MSNLTAALQLTHSGRSCRLQHFSGGNDWVADLPAVQPIGASDRSFAVRDPDLRFAQRIPAAFCRCKRNSGQTREAALRPWDNRQNTSDDWDGPTFTSAAKYMNVWLSGIGPKRANQI